MGINDLASVDASRQVGLMGKTQLNRSRFSARSSHNDLMAAVLVPVSKGIVMVAIIKALLESKEKKALILDRVKEHGAKPVLLALLILMSPAIILSLAVAYAIAKHT